MTTLTSRITLDGSAARATLDDLGRTIEAITDGVGDAARAAGETAEQVMAAAGDAARATTEAARAAADGLAGQVDSGRAAAAEARKLEQAYRTLGVTSLASVEQQRDAAAAALAVVEASGTATVEQLDAARAAVADLDEQVARLSGTAAADPTGGSVFSGLAAGAAEVGKALVGVVSGLGGLAAAAYRAVEGVAALVDEQAKFGRAMGLSVEQVGRLTYALGQSGVGEGQARQVFGKLSTLITGTVAAATDSRAAVTELHAEIVAQNQAFGAALARANASVGKDRAAAIKEAEKIAAKVQDLNGKLAAAAEGGRTALDDLGIAATDAAGNLRPTQDVLFDLADKFKAMPDGAEKTALAMRLFGEEAGPRMINALNGGRAGIIALGDEAAALGVVVDALTAASMEAFNDSLDATGKAAQGFRNDFARAIVPALTETNLALVAWVKDLRTVSPALNVAVGAALGMGGALKDLVFELGPVLIGFKLLGGNLSSLLVPFRALPGLLRAVGSGLGVVAGAIRVATAATLSWTAAILANPLTWVVAGVIAALAGLGYAIYQVIEHWELWVWGFEHFAEVVDDHLGGVATAIREAWSGVTAWLADTVGGWVDSFAGGWADMAALAGVVAGLIAARVRGLWDDAGAAVSGALDRAGAAVVGWWDGILASITETATAILDALVSPFRAAADLILGLWDGVLSAIRGVIDAGRQAVGLAPAGDGGAAPGYADGGVVRGPGTATSDSILARLSAGEYVVRARAVQAYGVEFLSALNALRLPRYAGGGLVSLPGVGAGLIAALSPLPGYAAGGLVAAPAGGPGGGGLGGGGLGGGATAVFDLGAGQRVSLPTTADALDSLSRAARLATGRPPRWQR